MSPFSKLLIKSAKSVFLVYIHQQVDVFTFGQHPFINSMKSLPSNHRFKAKQVYKGFSNLKRVVDKRTGKMM